MNLVKMTVNDKYRTLLVRDGTNDADWLRARQQNGVGASESPIICGMSPWGSVVKLYAQKLGLIDPDDENEAMKWGKIMEPHILDEYRAETGRRVRSAQALLQSIENPFMLATPDADQEAEDHDGRGTAQVKTTELDHDWKEGVPRHVWCQMQAEFAVTGYEWGTAIALLRRSRLVWADVERDDDFINSVIIPRCAEFWRCVVNHEPIPREWIDGSADEHEALKKMFPEVLAGETAVLDAELIDSHINMQELKATMKEADREVARLENQIRLAIGEKTFGKLPNGVTYSYKNQQRAGYEVKPASFRVLRLMKGSVN